MNTYPHGIVLSVLAGFEALVLIDLGAAGAVARATPKLRTFCADTYCPSAIKPWASTADHCFDSTVYLAQRALSCSPRIDLIASFYTFPFESNGRMTRAGGSKLSSFQESYSGGLVHS